MISVDADTIVNPEITANNSSQNYDDNFQLVQFSFYPRYLNTNG